MKRYLLDTCVLIWLLENNPRIKDIVDDITYFQGDFAVSVESIKEYLYLTQSGKLNTMVTYKKLLEVLRKAGILGLEIGLDALEALSELPFFKNHPDPSDRVIIAQAIAGNRILVTGDLKFDQYPKLKLLLV